jgi:hypothetical protein
MRRYLCLVILLLSASSAIAGAPALNEKCQDRSGLRVVTVYDTTRQYFAQALPMRRSEQAAARQRGLSPFVIYVNPSLYFLGRQTQQWLFLRQCIHIQEGHRIIQDGMRGLNMRDEVQVDCAAARALRTSSRTLYSIERDLQRALREGRWPNVLPGPQRRVSLSACTTK